MLSEKFNAKLVSRNWGQAMDVITEFVTLPEDGLDLEKAREAIAKLRGTRFLNRATGIPALLSSSAQGKLVSNKATGKSTANGFTRRQHNAMAAYIDVLYGVAMLVSSRPDKAGDANILSIKRFASGVTFGESKAVAWITVKESRQHGHHIYSVEAIKLEALDRKVEVVSGNTPHASSAPTSGIVSSFSACVKRLVGRILKGLGK